mmetsp:Transcript_37728/g.106613  ORF Transcript_37728/g.106613 Transcript_37728/m.106613 type:complete len:237 (+) Transcript_37728:358-1068(+)
MASSSRAGRWLSRQCSPFGRVMAAPRGAGSGGWRAQLPWISCGDSSRSAGTVGGRGAGAQPLAKPGLLPPAACCGRLLCLRAQHLLGSAPQQPVISSKSAALPFGGRPPPSPSGRAAPLPSPSPGPGPRQPPQRRLGLPMEARGVCGGGLLRALRPKAARSLRPSCHATRCNAASAAPARPLLTAARWRLSWRAGQRRRLSTTGWRAPPRSAEAIETARSLPGQLLRGCGGSRVWR